MPISDANGKESSRPEFETAAYRDEAGQVSWYGTSLEDKQFRQLLTGEVASILHDESASRAFESRLSGLAGSDFAAENVEMLLSAKSRNQREWEIGEAIAKAYLSRKHGIVWPWNANAI